MQDTRKEIIDRLLKSYRAYYNITLFEDEQKPLTAICEFFERSERYIVSRKANLWSAECEEFVYLFDIGQLTKETFEKYRDFAREDGMKRANIGPGHMYTYITVIFICDSCTADARRALKKCRIYKSFHFSLHGWMDFHAAALEVMDNNRISTNGSGRCVGKIMKNILFQTKKKRRRFL